MYRLIRIFLIVKMTSTGLSTAGAIPVRTDKGETMVKVKVQRYVSGRVPKYAEGATSSEDEDDFIMSNSIRPKIKQEPDERPVDLLETHDDYNDRRLRRLMKREHVPSSGPRDRHRAVGDDDRENEDDSDADAEENLERRHSLLIERRRQEEELLASEKEGKLCWLNLNFAFFFLFKVLKNILVIIFLFCNFR